MAEGSGLLNRRMQQCVPWVRIPHSLPKHMKIYQIYYKPEHMEHLDSGFIPYDNTENLNPHLAEWPNYYKIWKDYKDGSDEYCGMVSWKFKEKSGLSSKQVYDFIEQNPGHDVYIFNSALEHEACFRNVWEQGNFFHSGILNTVTEFFNQSGVTISHPLNSVIMTRENTVFAQYVVGNKKFWNTFFNVTNKLFSIPEHTELYKQIFVQKANYNDMPIFPFIIERMYSTVILGLDFNCKAFIYNEDNCPDRYVSRYKFLQELSDLKIQINQHQDNKLYEYWDSKRRKYQ